MPDPQPRFRTPCKYLRKTVPSDDFERDRSVEVWQEIAQGVLDLRPKAGAEIEIADGIESTVTYDAIDRWKEGIYPTDVVELNDGRRLNIRRAVNWEEKNRYLMLQLVERVQVKISVRPGVGEGSESSPGGGDGGTPGTADFVRTATGHPNFSLSDYGFTVVPTFAVNARSVGTTGGVLIADSETLIVTHTATSATAGTHTVRMGIHIPANGTLTVTSKIDGSVQSTAYKTAGEFNPTTLSDYNVIPVAVALTAGEVHTIELAYAHTAPGDDSTKALLDFADWASVASPPPPSGTLVWDWDAGDISKATYDAYVTAGSGFTLESNGRLTADDNSRELALVTSPQRMNFPISFEAPTMEANGDIRAFVEPSPTNSHSMFRMESSNFGTSWYVAPRTRFRWEWSCTFNSGSDWANLAWAIPVQLHPGSYPVGHDPQPVVAIYVYDGLNFTLTVRGNNQTVPAATWTSQNDVVEIPFSDGFHRFVLEFESDPDSSGTGSYCRLTMDGVVRATTTVDLGLMFSGHDNSDAYLTLTQGCYTTSSGIPASPNNPQIDHHSAKLYEL